MRNIRNKRMNAFRLCGLALLACLLAFHSTVPTRGSAEGELPMPASEPVARQVFILASNARSSLIEQVPANLERFLLKALGVTVGKPGTALYVKAVSPQGKAFTQFADNAEFQKWVDALTPEANYNGDRNEHIFLIEAFSEIAERITEHPERETAIFWITDRDIPTKTDLSHFNRALAGTAGGRVSFTLVKLPVPASANTIDQGRWNVLEDKTTPGGDSPEQIIQRAAFREIGMENIHVVSPAAEPDIDAIEVYRRWLENISGGSFFAVSEGVPKYVPVLDRPESVSFDLPIERPNVFPMLVWLSDVPAEVDASASIFMGDAENEMAVAAAKVGSALLLHIDASAPVFGATSADEMDATQGEEPAAELAAEPTEGLAAEPPVEATVESTPGPTAEPTAESAMEPAAEPASEPTPEPTAEPAAEPAAEPTPEPTEAPTEVPAEEPTIVPADTPQDAAYLRIQLTQNASKAALFTQEEAARIGVGVLPSGSDLSADIYIEVPPNLRQVDEFSIHLGLLADPADIADTLPFNIQAIMDTAEGESASEAFDTTISAFAWQYAANNPGMYTIRMHGKNDNAWMHFDIEDNLEIQRKPPAPIGNATAQAAVWVGVPFESSDAKPTATVALNALYQTYNSETLIFEIEEKERPEGMSITIDEGTLKLDASGMADSGEDMSYTSIVNVRDGDEPCAPIHVEVKLHSFEGALRESLRLSGVSNEELAAQSHALPTIEIAASQSSFVLPEDLYRQAVDALRIRMRATPDGAADDAQDMHIDFARMEGTDTFQAVFPGNRLTPASWALEYDASVEVVSADRIDLSGLVEGMPPKLRAENSAPEIAAQPSSALEILIKPKLERQNIQLEDPMRYQEWFLDDQDGDSTTLMYRLTLTSVSKESITVEAIQGDESTPLLLSETLVLNAGIPLLNIRLSEYGECEFTLRASDTDGYVSEMVVRKVVAVNEAYKFIYENRLLLGAAALFFIAMIALYFIARPSYKRIRLNLYVGRGDDDAWYDCSNLRVNPAKPLNLLKLAMTAAVRHDGAWQPPLWQYEMPGLEIAPCGWLFSKRRGVLVKSGKRERLDSLRIVEASSGKQCGARLLQQRGAGIAYAITLRDSGEALRLWIEH